MLNLLRKDFIALKSSLWISILHFVIFSVTFMPQLDASLYFIGIITAFAALSLGTAIDIKNNSHQFLITLPIRRNQIILAKYASAVIYAVFWIVVSFAVHWLANIIIPELGKPNYSLADIIISIEITLVLASIYLPLFYALNKKGAAVINSLFIVSFIIFAQPTAYMINSINEDNLLNQLTFMFPVATLAIFAASYYLTTKLFAKRAI